MTDEKPKKTRAPKAAKPPTSVETLVTHALKLAATKPTSKWIGASAAALFNTKEANHEAAIAACTNPDAPLLKQADKVGVLTAAGFERIVAELPAEEVGTLARATAAGMPVADRVTFLQGTISRTPDLAAELIPLLDEAVAADKAESDARVAATTKRAAAEAANRAALERVLELSEQAWQNKVDALRREWEALGQKPSDLPAHKVAPEPQPAATGSGPEPKTTADKDFRRSEADRLAAAWRDAWDANKDEGRDCLEAAMWNIRGLRMLGEVGEKTVFDGRHHESSASVFTYDPVEIVRPGWLLKENEGDYVALKAAVDKS